MNKSIENMMNFYEKQDTKNVSKSSDPLEDLKQRYKNDPDSLTNVELMTLGLERVQDIDEDQGDAEKDKEEYVSNAEYEKAKKAHDDVKKELETLKNESKS